VTRQTLAIAGTSPVTLHLDLAHDPLGRRAEVHSQAGVRRFEYPAQTQHLTLDRFDGAAPGGYWIERAYTQLDPLGNILEVSGASADSQLELSASYTYDRRNRLASWQRPGSPAQHFTHDVLGNLTGHGVASAGATNQLFAHPSMPHAVTAKTDAGSSYTYDADGNRVSETSAQGTRHFRFDSASRLVCQGSSPGACNGIRIGYDAAGSRIVEQDYMGTRRVYVGEHFTLIGANRAEWHIRAFGETVGFKYDDSIALRTASSFGLPLPALWPLAPWLGALAGMLLAVALALLGAELGLWEPLARRPVGSGVALALVLLVALPPLPLSAGGGGGGVLLRRWLVTDHLGSGVLWLDPDGNRVRHTVYAPFGAVAQEVTSGGDQPPQIFAGHRRGAVTGLHYMQARWQDPSTGSFVSVDPVVAQIDDPQSYVAYAYARNGPASLVDPDGRTSIYPPVWHSAEAAGFDPVVVTWNAVARAEHRILNEARRDRIEKIEHLEGKYEVLKNIYFAFEAFEWSPPIPPVRKGAESMVLWMIGEVGGGLGFSRSLLEELIERDAELDRLREDHQRESMREEQYRKELTLEAIEESDPRDVMTGTPTPGVPDLSGVPVDGSSGVQWFYISPPPPPGTVTIYCIGGTPC
jgi:RHS repeat-associated protein